MKLLENELEYRLYRSHTINDAVAEIDLPMDVLPFYRRCSCINSLARHPRYSFAML